MVNANQGSNRYQFFSLWLDPAGNWTFHTWSEHSTCFSLLWIALITIENCLLISVDIVVKILLSINKQNKNFKWEWKWDLDNMNKKKEGKKIFSCIHLELMQLWETEVMICSELCTIKNTSKYWIKVDWKISLQIQEKFALSLN